MSKIQILVVEDDLPVRNLITTTLKAQDYRYLTAETGEGAIMETATHNPDIILLDLGLPDLDGVEVIRRVRSWSNTPIIVISARSEDSDKIDALDAGADDYLTKPFSVEELLARLRVTQRRLALMQNTQTTSSIYKNGQLRVDYASGCVYFADEELHLTPEDLRYSTNILLDGMHTYSATEEFEVIDIKTRRLNLVNLVMRIKHKLHI